MHVHSKAVSHVLIMQSHHLFPDPVTGSDARRFVHHVCLAVNLDVSTWSSAVVNASSGNSQIHCQCCAAGPKFRYDPVTVEGCPSARPACELSSLAHPGPDVPSTGTPPSL